MGFWIVDDKIGGFGSSRTKYMQRGSVYVSLNSHLLL